MDFLKLDPDVQSKIDDAFYVFKQSSYTPEYLLWLLSLIRSEHQSFEDINAKMIAALVEPAYHDDPPTGLLLKSHELGNPRMINGALRVLARAEATGVSTNPVLGTKDQYPYTYDPDTDLFRTPQADLAQRLKGV